MAITTYAELQTAAANWLGRADLTSRIPEFIVLFEAKFNRTMRVLEQEKRNATFSITGEYVAVPTDFIELRSMHLTTDPKRPLRLMPPDTQVDAYNSGTGIPIFVSVTGHTTIDGTKAFRFAPVPDATYTAVLTYYARLSALSGAVNWLLTNHPDVYLYGTLLEASAFVQDDPRLPIWKTAYDEALGSLKYADNRSRWGAGGMTIRPA